MFKNRQLSYTGFKINEFLDNFRAIRGEFTSFYSIKRKDQNYRHICALFYWIWKKGTKRIHKLLLPSPPQPIWLDRTGGRLHDCVNMVRTLRRFLIRNLHSSNFYTPPFCSPWHAISKNVFKISVAPFLPVVVKLVKNGHFYNVNLA